MTVLILFVKVNGHIFLSFNDEKTSLYQAKAFYSSLVSEDMFTIKYLKIDKDEQKASSFLDLMLEIFLLSVLIM